MVKAFVAMLCRRTASRKIEPGRRISNDGADVHSTGRRHDEIRFKQLGGI
jgi:hypothetical protein